MGLPEVAIPKEEKTRKRPARLDLASAKKVPGGSASGSASLGTGTGTTAPITALKTPKELAHDIALQCVSPAIPSFMNSDKITLSKSIEAQQRKIIAQRSQAVTSDDGSGAGGAGPQSASASPTTGELPRSAGSMNPDKRAPRPRDIEIYPSRVPIHQSPPYTSSLTPSRVQAGAGASPRTNRTTIYLRSDGGRRYFGTAVQSARPQYASPTWGFIRGHARSRSTEATVRDIREEGSEDEEEVDPEDAALSDDEPAQKAISPEDETAAAKHKRTHPYDTEEPEANGHGDAARRRREKKMRFMSLCSEIWDLLHEE